MILKHLLSKTLMVVVAVGVVRAATTPTTPGPVMSFSAAATSQQESLSAPTASTAPQRAILSQYCVTCHNGEARTAGLVLSSMDFESVDENAPVLERIVKKLRTGAMPPAGWPRPSDDDYDTLAGYLEAKLDQAAERNLNPGRPVMRRMNRVEYSNAVRDLLALDTSALDIQSLLPPDESTHGFDNVGDGLSVSPLFLEQYLSAARKVTRLAIGESNIQPYYQTYTVPKYLMQDDRMGEDLAFGTRGGTAIHHYFPVDGEYVVSIRLQRNARDYIRGLAEPHELEVRVDGGSIALFQGGGEIRGRNAGIFSRGNLGDPAQEEYERVTADEHLEIRLPVKAGTHVVTAAFLKEISLPEGPLQQRLSQNEYSQYKGGLPAVGSVTIGGPFDTQGVEDTPSRRRIFTCQPGVDDNEEGCARKMLSALAHRAYRRPLTDADVEELLGFFQSGRESGTFEDGIASAIERILLGPEFLFHGELDPLGIAPNTAYRISDVELASRLSFFLWSSIPDEELLDLAEEGRLSSLEVLEQQVQRMLQDSRSEAFVNNLAGQWLLLRNLRLVDPDLDSFPYFDDSLRVAFERETVLFLESLVREDRSMVDLLNADYTFVNERLAEFYGILNVHGSHFRRVRLVDENRRGLLGQGSILTVTSYANRTSPVFRGKWVLENILGAPPPAPPDNVPDLEENSGARFLTIRERMEEHRANPACAVCHNQMDPIGLALENFDGIGRWRTTEGTTPIDPSGTLPDGTEIGGPSDLRAALLKKPEQFVTTVTEKVLTYALGRGLEHYDAPAVRQIVRQAAPNNYRWSSIVLGIVESTPFQMRRSKAP